MAVAMLNDRSLLGWVLASGLIHAAGLFYMPAITAAGSPPPGPFTLQLTVARGVAGAAGPELPAPASQEAPAPAGEREPSPVSLARFEPPEFASDATAAPAEPVASADRAAEAPRPVALPRRGSPPIPRRKPAPTRLDLETLRQAGGAAAAEVREVEVEPVRPDARLAGKQSPPPGVAAAAPTAPAGAGTKSREPVTTTAAAAVYRGLDPDRGSLMNLLHREISRQKRYPVLARRQQREGIATVSFDLRPDGEVDELTLSGSSGFSLLDQAALRAVAGVVPFRPAARYLSRAQRFRVQVEFKLN